MIHSLSRIPIRYPLTLIWLLAISLNLSLWTLYYAGDSPKILVADEAMYFGLVEQVAAGEVRELAPLWPPGYQVVLSLLHMLSQAISASFLGLVQVFQVCLWAIGGVFFWKITQQLLATSCTRLIALSLFLLYPTLTAFSHYLWPEIPHLALYLAVLWVFIEKPTSVVWNGLAGVLMGFAALLKLVYLPIALLLLLGVFCKNYTSSKNYTLGLMASLLFLLVLSPTLYHNHQKHGIWMIADSSAFNIWVGLHDTELTDWNEDEILAREYKRYTAAAPSHRERKAIYRKMIWDFVQEEGIINMIARQSQKQFFRLFDHRTFFTKQLPGGMKPRYGFENIEVANALRVFNAGMWALILIGFGIGIWHIPWSKHPIWGILGLIVLYNLGLFLFLHVKTRYTLQFLPIICFMAGAGWMQVKGWLTSSEPIVWWRMTGSLLCITLLLMFAFT